MFSINQDSHLSDFHVTRYFLFSFKKILSESGLGVGVGGCNGSLPISGEHLRYVVSLYECFNNNTLGKLWTSSMPYLFPFIVEYRIKIELHFSLIAAAVTYIMWKHVGDDRINGGGASGNAEKKLKEIDGGTNGATGAGVGGAGVNGTKKRGSSGYWRVDCQSASKGLFLGLLCLVGGVIILIIFFVMKDTAEFADDMFWIFSGAEIAILALSVVGCVGGFVQLQKLSLHPSRRPYDLDELLSSVTVTGAYIYAIFSAIAAGVDLGGIENNNKSVVVFALHALLLLQVSMQGDLIRVKAWCVLGCGK